MEVAFYAKVSQNHCTTKEREVSNRQIAEMLDISRNTVNSAVNAIIAKFIIPLFP